jgi:hypothetical protein
MELRALASTILVVLYSALGSEVQILQRQQRQSLQQTFSRYPHSPVVAYRKIRTPCGLRLFGLVVVEAHGVDGVVAVALFVEDAVPVLGELLDHGASCTQESAIS